MSVELGVKSTYERVIDLGAGDNPDPRADQTTDLHYEGADYVFDLTDEWPLGENSVDGLVARHVFEHIPREEIPQVFAEAARVLTPTGWFEMRVPLGSDAKADPTHVSDWHWRMPELYCDDRAHWIPDIPFRVEKKRLNIWMIRPLELLTPPVRFAAKHWPNDAWGEIPGTTGEMIVLFRNEVHHR